MTQETLLSKLEKRQQANTLLYTTRKFPRQLSLILSWLGLQFLRIVLPLSLSLALPIWLLWKDQIYDVTAQLLWL